ncbi:hypothetical protein F5B22DRAFT_649618 [Xylaria bambusicola]|uniref:uncharacterized protein n=1 Tax=Xylaria bambusicola TaxID=326684 RepID=UPI002007AF5F|nr:uncharacterized protein F5B22DRAFT_649618 [Xylaria bambusicola]KAI0508919.1 hypothetical protein F5B22DRAFT_649618 [Xylaria bambusicola]
MSRQPSQNHTSSTATSFCQAIYFYYTCGCRKPEPVFCCQPPVNSPTKAGNPCRHEQPALVVAKLPRACGKLLGSSAACGAEDPSAKRFVREVDTSERLELAVSKGLKQDMVSDALPEKVEGTFTIDEVISKSRQKFRSFLSATAAPFVPQLGAFMASAAIPAVADGESHQTTEGVMEDNTIAGVSRVTAAVCQAEEIKCRDFATEMDANKASRSAKIEDSQDNQDDREELYEIELSHPDIFPTIADESPDEGAPGIDDTTQEESVGSSIEPRKSYEELVTYWAIDNSKEKLKPSRTCYWAVATLFSNFIRRN